MPSATLRAPSVRREKAVSHDLELLIDSFAGVCPPVVEALVRANYAEKP